MVSVTSAHIGGMTILRATQIALLAAALLLGLTAPAFNGLSVIALILAGVPLAIGHYWGRKGSEAS
jgi:hypothetical protein